MEVSHVQDESSKKQALICQGKISMLIGFLRFGRRSVAANATGDNTLLLVAAEPTEKEEIRSAL